MSGAEGLTETRGTERLEHRQVAVPGRRLALRRWDPAGGSAAENPPVLLLHGVPETSACFDELAATLATDRVVLAPDLPGLGNSEVRGPYDVRSVTSSLLSLLASELDGVADGDLEDGELEDGEREDGEREDGDPEGEPVRIDVVGHDWGGSIGLALAAARPDLVRRLVVISAPYRKVDLARAWHIPMLGLVPPG